MTKFTFLCFFVMAMQGATAQQKIKDGTGTPVTSLPAAGSLLELQSTQAGIRFPQVSLTDTKTWAPLLGSGAAATSPGMTVYNTNTGLTNTTADANYPALGKGEYYWDGTGWVVKNPVAAAAYVEPWYNTATNTGATTNTQNIYQMGNAGIGITTPQSRLDVRGTTKILANPVVQTGSFWNGTSNVNGFEVTTDQASGDVWVGIQRTGNVAPLHLSKPAGNTSGPMLIFSIAAAAIGQITCNATSVQYNTTSDIRLKENINATHYGIADVMKIKVADYNYKSDKTKTVTTGFLAQDLYKIYPEAVTPGGADEKTNPWMVEYGKVTPLLVKAMQDQQKEIAELKAQIAELKALIKK
jgi:hypothetical protein